jgi:hypothetical protein
VKPQKGAKEVIATKRHKGSLATKRHKKAHKRESTKEKQLKR